MTYHFADIIINNNVVNIEAILKNIAIPENDFEENTFAFIRDWLNGKTPFNQQTSGSTGIPKTITLKREQIQKSALATIRFLGINPGGTALLCLNPEYIAGKMMLARAIEGNLKIIAVNPSDNPLQTIPLNTTIDLTALIPYQAFSLIRNENVTKSKLIKHILLGGAPLPKALEEDLLSNNINAYETFGMTETISHIALRKIGEPYFKTLPEISIGTDERSCLIIKANYLEDSLVKSNDIVKLINNESFAWVGRWDNVINSGGIKISPEQEEPIIKEVLDLLNINQRFYLKGRAHEKLGTEPVLVVEGVAWDPELENMVVQMLKKRLKTYHAPSKIEYMAQFNVTGTRKLIRD